MPRLVPNVEILTVEGKSILMVETFPSSSRPHHLRNEGHEQGTFVRLGSSNRQAGSELITELRRSATGIAFDEQPMPQLSKDDLDIDGAQRVFGNQRSLTDEALLTLRLLTHEQGRLVPTIGGILLFGKKREHHFPDAWIQCGRFIGTDKAHIFDHIEIHAHLPECVEQIMDFLKKHAMRGADFSEIQRKDVWSIPFLILREAVINALVHADYSHRGAPIRTHIEPAHAHLRTRILLVTTGDMKQDTQLSWTSYIDQHSDRAGFEFWSGDKVAELIANHMLDEHVFLNEDRTDLRRALALAGDSDYDLSDLDRVFLRQLGISHHGKKLDRTTDGKALKKALLRLNLVAHMFVQSAERAGDTRRAVLASERALLWSWHRLLLVPTGKRHAYYEGFGLLWLSYLRVGAMYFRKLEPYFHVPDGMSVHNRENAATTVVLFEHIGLTATLGLAHASMALANSATARTSQNSAHTIAAALADMLENNPSTGSPRLDNNVVEISLGLLLFVLTNHHNEAKQWLTQLVIRLDFCFKQKRYFPVGTDSIDDLIDLTVNPSPHLAKELMGASWMLATIAAWCAILEMDEEYAFLTAQYNDHYSSVTPQLWHADADWQTYWYFEAAHHASGETEAPYRLPAYAAQLRDQIREFLCLKKYDMLNTSAARQAGIFGLDFIASRHFRTPVPAAIWYSIIAPERELTPWFIGTDQPGRIGIYEREHPMETYSFWDGTKWLTGACSPHDAAKQTSPSEYQNMPWRGFIKSPSHVRKENALDAAV